MQVLRWIFATMVLALLGACATPSLNDDSGFVAIDRKEPAYTVYVGIPAEKLEETRRRLAREEGWELVPWTVFRNDPERYVGARIARDDYPGSRAAEGVVRLIQKYPGNPVGLTWNGGIAITYADYRHAKKTHELYVSSPTDYERSRITDPRRDPVHPKVHLGPLLGW